MAKRREISRRVNVMRSLFAGILAPSEGKQKNPGIALRVRGVGFANLRFMTPYWWRGVVMEEWLFA